MVYKIGNTEDIKNLPSMTESIRERVSELARALSILYGKNRNVDSDDGGYILYVEPGTTAEELKQAFDYTSHTVEYISCDYTSSPPVLSVFYVLNNEFTVSIVMSADDAPDEIRKEIEEDCKK